MIEPGARVVHDRYVLRSLIGRGGSGSVYRATDRDLQRSVAVKHIVLDAARPGRRRSRALREAQAAARLRTPGVVQVYDVLDDGADVYLVMELVDAPSLARLVRRRGPLAPARAAAVGQAVLRILATVHGAGIVHRDVKPSNVLVDGDDVRLTDFGIALLTDDAPPARARSIVGTPTYMAPEQAAGGPAGPPADLYGLGATLYYAVEGRAPFDRVGGVWQTTRAVRDVPHRPGTQLGPLRPLVDGLLAKDPAARPDVADIAAALAVIAAPGDLAPPPWRGAGAPGPAATGEGAAATVPSVGPARDAGAGGDDRGAAGPRRPTGVADVGDAAPRGRRWDRRTVALGLAVAVILVSLLVALFLAVAARGSATVSDAGRHPPGADLAWAPED